MLGLSSFLPCRMKKWYVCCVAEWCGHCLQVHAVHGVSNLQLLDTPDPVLRVPRGAAAAAAAVCGGHDADAPGPAPLHFWLPAQCAQAAERSRDLHRAVPQHGAAGQACATCLSLDPAVAETMSKNKGSAHKHFMLQTLYRRGLVEPRYMALCCRCAVAGPALRQGSLLEMRQQHAAC